MCCNLNAAYVNFEFDSDPTADSYTNLKQIQSPPALTNARVYPHFSGDGEGGVI